MDWKESWTKLAHLQGQQSTPFYLFHAEKAKEAISTLRTRLGSSIQIAFAVKANPWLINSLVDSADYFEICSEGELRLCEKSGIPGNRIFLDGVWKGKSFLRNAIRLGVRRISIDSVGQLRDIVQILESPKDLQLFFRLSSGNQFGMNLQECREAISLLQQREEQSITGIQYYPGTQRANPLIVKKELRHLADSLDILEEIDGFRVSELEFGAGIGVPYFEGETDEPYLQCMDTVNEFIKGWQQKGYQITYESGRQIAASCGVYVTKIYAEKCRDDKRILFCQGGTNHLVYPGGMLGIRSPQVESIVQNPSGVSEECMICGSLCNTADVLSRCCRTIDKNASEGDYLVHNAGAYSATEAPNLFLTMEIPKILLYNNENEVSKISVLRDSQPTDRLINDRIE